MRGMGFEPDANARSARVSVIRIAIQTIHTVLTSVRTGFMRGMGFEPMDPYGSGS